MIQEYGLLGTGIWNLMRPFSQLCLVFYSLNLVLSKSVFLYHHIILVDGDIYMSLQMVHMFGYRICVITS